MRRASAPALFSALLVLFCAPSPGRSVEEVPAEYRRTIDRGLTWLANQQRADGRWEANSGHHPVSMTSLAGLALLMEGSTLREGKYHKHLNKAANWLLGSARSSGLIDNSTDEVGSRSLFGHGHAMLFLACAAGELPD